MTPSDNSFTISPHNLALLHSTLLHSYPVPLRTVNLIFPKIAPKLAQDFKEKVMKACGAKKKFCEIIARNAPLPPPPSPGPFRVNRVQKKIRKKILAKREGKDLC